MAMHVPFLGNRLSVFARFNSVRTTLIKSSESVRSWTVNSGGRPMDFP